MPRTASAIALVLLVTGFSYTPPAYALDPSAEYVIVISNDLGMHCMNKDHANLSVLPPFNTLNAQVIRRGDGTTTPQIVTSGITLEYSIPGNTYSVGKTDFWDWDVELFGVDLPPNVGLTGKGMTGTFDLHGDVFIAEGIPLTPFTDANPTVEDPYQLALVIALDSIGTEIARSRPVMPVSTEMNCLGSGCHSSEFGILDGHEGPSEGGFDPADAPILCAGCHGQTPLTGPDPGAAGWLSQRMHEKHAFIDEEIPGMAGCERCHPGPTTQCLRGTMAEDFSMICQDCHGNMHEVKNSIDNGRIPWVDEPACRNCHTSVYGEPAGVLYRNATGHGGVLCSGCHNSPHAIFPSRESRDNEVMVDLQGHAGTLEACQVCHGTVPSGAGPHGFVSTAVSHIEEEIFTDAALLAVYPSPLKPGRTCTVVAPMPRASAEGRLLVFDLQGRTVRMLPTTAGGGRAVSTWDGRDSSGRPVASGVYFMRWEDSDQRAAGKVTILN